MAAEHNAEGGSSSATSTQQDNHFDSDVDLNRDSSKTSVEQSLGKKPLLHDVEGIPAGREFSRRYNVRFQDDDNKDITTDIMGWLSKRRQGLAEYKRYTLFQWAALFLPCLNWLRTYDVKGNLLSDVAAGLSLGTMVVPQGLSYAKLAGLPSVYGLYGTFIPVIVYVALGSSRQLVAGPVAVTSLLLGAGIPKLIDRPIQDDPNNPRSQAAQDEYNQAAIQVALLAGILYTSVGLLRLGWITNFLSHSVMAGFITGASVIIGMQQIKFFFGYNKAPNPDATGTLVTVKTISFPRNDPVYKQLGDLFGPTWFTSQVQWRELVMGISWLIVLITFKETSKRVHRLRWLKAFGPITVTIMGIAIVSIFGLAAAPANIRVVGNIPSGLPGVTANLWFPMANFGGKLSLAVIVCIVDILESISIAKALALKNGYDLDPTQELRGLGIANVAGALFNCYTTTGSFSRSALNNDIGGKTQVSSFVMAMVVMLTLLVLTPVFKNMPQTVQGAIILVAVSTLFNYTEFLYLWKVNKFDWIVFTVAALGVAFIGVEVGLIIAISLSIVIVLYKTAFPHTAILGRLPDTNVYRNVKQYPEAHMEEGILILRIDAPIYFANVHPIREKLAKYESRAAAYSESKGQRLRFIIIDMAPVSDIDASALHFLTEWINDHKRRKLQPIFCNPNKKVVRVMENGNLQKLIGEEWIFARTHDAVTFCKTVLMEEASGKGLTADFASAPGQSQEPTSDTTTNHLVSHLHAENI